MIRPTVRAPAAPNPHSIAAGVLSPGRRHLLAEYSPHRFGLTVQGTPHLVTGVRRVGSDLSAANRSGTVRSRETRVDVLFAHVREHQADLKSEVTALVSHSAQQRVHAGFVRHDLRAREAVLRAKEIKPVRRLQHKGLHPDVHTPSLSSFCVHDHPAGGTALQHSDVRICRGAGGHRTSGCWPSMA
jgi:hypothetical protein